MVWRGGRGLWVQIHECDFKAKYSTQGLDLVELRAVFAATPERWVD